MTAADEQGGSAGEPGTSVGLVFELPDGWYCLEPHRPEAAGKLRGLVPSGGASQITDALAATRARLVLIHPGPLAIAGAVFVSPPLRLGGAEVCGMLDAAGETSALGDLDGLPVVSLVRHADADITLVQISYLICAPAATATLTFVGPARPDTKSVVDEAARVVSGARVVRSTDGCPVYGVDK